MAPMPTGKGKARKIPGIVKLLFETPSGFAIFTFDETYLKKDIEHIWIYFVGNHGHKNIVWLDEFRKFEDKSNVINLTAQTIHVGLTQMLWKNCDFDDTLVVGNLAYKDLIGKLLGLHCHYEDAVNEVMWGLQNLMHTLLPQEQSVMTKDDLLPMSLGLNMVLTRYRINVEKEMVSLARDPTRHLTKDFSIVRDHCVSSTANSTPTVRAHILCVAPPKVEGRIKTAQTSVQASRDQTLRYLLN